jgi:DNA-nicking Smr family endonuclease
MARSKINRNAKANSSTCHMATPVPNHITPAFLGHRSPLDVQNAIKFHRDTLTNEVCQFLLSNPPNLRVFVEFWSRPMYSNLTSSRAADTICGASWMLALNHLFLNQVEAARAFMLNGAFIHQCAHKSIGDILVLCHGGSTPLCDHVVNDQLPYYQSAFALSHSKEDIEKYLRSVIPLDLMRRMSFASHAGHKSTSTWVHDYVQNIGNDWGSSSHHPKRAVKGIDDSTIEITILNTECNNEMQVPIGVSHTLKELFTKYSEEQGVPLRSLRFVFDGKPLFVSSASGKTPAQLGMRDHDVICVASVALSSTSQDAKSSTTDELKEVPRKKTTKKRGNKSKRAKPSKVVYIEQDPKVLHSQALSRLFDEAEPSFRAIRQQLNNLTLERTLPKEKSFKRKAPFSIQQQPVESPNTEGLAGKAGKTSYVIQVGEVNNLYKSSKKSQVHVPKSQFIDLHGYTQIEALDKLNQSLPQWEKYAMEGSYPFVAPVVIVCGGGNQILSDTVSQWIKENNVSNAPKNMFASAA